MELQVGVKALLRDSEGRYLLLRKSLERYPEVGGRWEIVGGRIEPGTPLLENLKREILEETGLIFAGIPVLFAAQDILRVPGRHVVRLTYKGGIEGDPVLTDEHLEYRWCTADEIRAMGEDELEFYIRELVGKGILEEISEASKTGI